MVTDNESLRIYELRMVANLPDTNFTNLRMVTDNEYVLIANSPIAYCQLFLIANGSNCQLIHRIANLVYLCIFAWVAARKALKKDTFEINQH
jgi:hypothetical protein